MIVLEFDADLHKFYKLGRIVEHKVVNTPTHFCSKNGKELKAIYKLP
jgi:hypothetical protein